MDAVSGAVLIVGCGHMGGAMARGWAASEQVHVHGRHVGDIPGTHRIPSLIPEGLPMPLTIVIAVKPAALDAVLPQLTPFVAAGCLLLSVVAGATLARLGRALGAGARIIRTMPNTAASIGKGVTAVVPGPGVTDADRARADTLLRALGTTLWLDDEAKIDAVTAISGSGPAYFFRFAEALARAGEICGLDRGTAMTLARETFKGAAALADRRNEPLDALRGEVTSPGGTTAAALAAFDRDGALDHLVERAARAAAARSHELSA